MLAGRRAFSGASSIEVMSAILKEDPPELPDPVPPALKLIVEHCLEKSPDRRFQSARDLAFALQSLTGSTAAAVAVVPAKRSAKGWMILAGVAVLAAVGVAFWLGKSSSARRYPPFAA